MNEQDLYDVAIIGGGLAGLSLAIQSADYGLKVILFEKEVYPFHKVCGEYISLESWNFLQRMGIDLQQLRLPIIKTLELSDAGGSSYQFHLPLGGFGISRFTLDNSLYTIALQKGVRVETNSKVNDAIFNNDQFTITSSTVSVKAKIAAGAFGKRSNIDVKWKRSFTVQKPGALNNYIGIKYHINYSHDPTHIGLHNFHDGYCGLSRIEDDKSCLCYLTTAANLRSCHNSIAELEERVLYKNPRLKDIFSKASFLYEQPIAISQISFEKKLQVENHALMLGDAAGMISPLCGNGMSMALHSSKLAFETLSKFLTGDFSRQQMEEEYTLKWKNQFSKRLWVGRTVQRIFGGNTSTSLFFKAMHSLPFLSDMVIRSTHGKPF